MPAEQRVWTIIDIIRWGTGYLTDKGFDEARLTVELLLSETLGLKRFDLYVKHDQPLKQGELEKLRTLIKRRLAHEPVQYILGKTTFYSIDLKVDRRALIPRPETEILAEAVIEHCRTFLSQKEGVRVLDIGTGSGCIAIAIARFVKNASVTAIDSSAQAIELADENSRATKTDDRIHFMQSDFLKGSVDSFEGPFDIVVSNPPYIPASEFSGLPEEIRSYEPSNALTDGGDGLGFFRKIAESAPTLLRSGGWVFVETADGQAKHVADIFSGSGGSEVGMKKDLLNIERVVMSRFFVQNMD